FLHDRSGQTLLSSPTRRSSDLPRQLGRHAIDDGDQRLETSCDLLRPREPATTHDDLEIVEHEIRGLALLHDERAELWIGEELTGDRKSTRLNSSHDQISYAVFC